MFETTEREPAMRSCRRYALALLSLLVPAAAGADVVVRVVTPVPDATSLTGTRLEPLTALGFRYLIEEDNTEPVDPADAANPRIPSLTIKKSHTPVVRAGVNDGPGVAAVAGLSTDGRYAVSVLPLNTTTAQYTLGGASFTGSDAEVLVIVHPQPIPTAQISVHAFHDSRPINAAPDIPAEPGLEGFTVQIFDAGGQVMQDAFGNMLGTSYRRNPDGTAVIDAEGNPVVDMPGDGVILTDANGEALVENLYPGKYGVKVVPPAGSGWIQTSTIEGTHVVDAWVKAGEPPYFAEWGFFMWHAFFGFVQPQSFPETPLDPATGLPDGSTGSVEGRVVYVHDSHPPEAPGLSSGRPVQECWVGLNDLDALDEQVFVGPCLDDQGHFSIPDVPPGNYMLTLWDFPLDAIIDFRVITVNAGQILNLQDIPIYAWFGNLEGSVFFDENRNGVRDADEPGIPGQAINLRYADGSIYGGGATDPEGNYALREVFPFFYPLIVEVDFLRDEATGMTAVVDNGGTLPHPLAVNRPQWQFDPVSGTWGQQRTEQGEVLTQMVSTYAGQTNVIDWGKAYYGFGPGADWEHGGISGVVYYAVTRAEDDPRYAAVETWEPGVPRVQMNLYRDGELGLSLPDGVVDDVNGVEGIQYADADNYPLGWSTGGAKGDEDVDRNGNGAFDAGDAIQIAWTDSWDDSLPTGCVDYWRDPTGGTESWWSTEDPASVAVHPQLYGGATPLAAQDCADTLRTWNQVRPAVFDGGYAFKHHFPGGRPSDAVEEDPRQERIPTGTYIVEALPPPGYEIQKEEDKNVESGDVVYPAVLPPVCVGDTRPVPEFQTLFPGQQLAAPFAGEERPLCDRKQVRVAPGLNAASDFFVFTHVPKAARIWGMALNDVLLAFDPDDPLKGTNFGVPHVPISIQDWSGNEIQRTYTDRWGKYDAVVPSTYTVNVASPSGVAPNILTVCLNSPGRPDPATGGFWLDPHYNPQYGQTCTNWEFWPGKTTRLDTPILPIGAFSGNPIPPSCEELPGTPALHSAVAASGGPYVTSAGGALTLTGSGFGMGGVVTLGGVPLPTTGWSDTVITASIPAFPTSLSAAQRRALLARQLMVTRSDGATTPMGITVFQARPQDLPVVVVNPGPGTPLQTAIDTAPAGALVLVRAGTYPEAVIVWKDLYLQGAGAGVTTLVAGPRTPAQVAAWQSRMTALEVSNQIDLVPGERADFFLENGAGVTVVSRSGGQQRDSRIDGLRVTGAIRGGGIFVNAFASSAQGRLSITNNRLAGNQGSFGGGIRLGTPSLVDNQGTGYLGNGNADVTIQYNQVLGNGAIDGGGGIAVFNGADRYRILDNTVCGNFSLLYGGGIAHLGLSPGGEIRRNRIVSNEAFDEGGGIMIAGELVPAGAVVGTLSQGAGSVLVDANLVQGNKAGDDGGGIRALMVNGQDLRGSPNARHVLRIFNNLVVNNSSADAGGGIALFDTVGAFVVHNTVAHNDSTATGVDAFGGPCVENVPPGNTCAGEGQGGLTTSVPQVAGIASRLHSEGVQAALGQPGSFSNPTLQNNVVWQNRALHWNAALPPFGGLEPDPASPLYWDLGVYPIAAGGPQLAPQGCVLTDATPYPGAGNVSTPPAFLSPYFNTNLATSAGAAFGNFVVVTFAEAGLWNAGTGLAWGDYHLAAGTAPAVVPAPHPALGLDHDQEPRPQGIAVEIGADEIP
jgi:hypothetical protein